MLSKKSIGNTYSEGEHEGTQEEKEKWIAIGKVASVHLPLEQLRLIPFTDHLERFKGLSSLRLLSQTDEIILLKIAKVRVNHNTVTVTLAEPPPKDLKGWLVVVSKRERFQLPKDEYYIDDLLGLEVKDPQGRNLGFIAEIFKTKAHDIYCIRDQKGNELLLPATKKAIKELSIEKGFLIADPEEGFLQEGSG